MSCTWALLAVAGCGSGGAVNTAPAFPSIIITVTSPTALANTSGVVRFSGTLAPSVATVTALKVELKVKGTLVGSGGGGTFAVDVDTTQKDKKGKPLFKDGKVCITFSAVGSDNATGSTSHCVTSDNSDPSVVMTLPVADTVHIGDVRITGTVSEKYLKDMSVSVDGQRLVGFCNEKIVGADKKPLCSLAACRAKYGLCLSKSGGYDVVIDRSTQPTKVVTIVVEATDMTGHTFKIERKIKVLRPPTWDVAHTFDGKTAKERKDKVKKLVSVSDLLVYDFDRDGALDALVATTTGVWLMRGYTANGGLPKGSGNFLPAEQVSAVPLTRMVLVDIDGDQIKDVYGIGFASTTTFEATAGYAFLTKKGGLRNVAKIPLQGTARAVATGDMDRNGTMDLVVGALEDAFAIQVVPALADIKCPSKDAPDRLCSEVVNVSDLGAAQIFGQPVTTPMSGGINVVVVADFFIGGKEVYPDIIIGRDLSATITACENNKGTLLGCKTTQANDFTADMTDASLMVPVDWNTDGKMDLIVASKGVGLVRWLASNGDGTFSYTAGKSRDILLKEITSLSIGPVGPSNKDYVMIGHGGRTVAFVPVLIDDRSHRDKCFRSWILGGSIQGVTYGDLDGDGDVDLIGIDQNPAGVAVALGTGDGNYHAATVHRICGLRKGGFQFGTLPVAKFKLGDVSADNKPDLLLISNAVTSRRSRAANMCQSKLDKTKFVPQPAHVVHLYVNEGTKLEEAARAGEWGPYTTIGLQQAHGVREVGEATCGVVMPDLSALEFGELNGKAPMDMVIARSQDYTTGTPPDAEGACPFKEQNEVANLFGLQKGGTESAPGPKCKNFRDKDEKKNQALESARGGAPLRRASVVTFINGDPAKPFGLSAGHRPDDPVELRPQFMFAGGRKPISLVVGRFDKDEIDDIATLMAEENGPSQKDYLPARVRIFRSTSALEGGIVKPVLYFTQGTSQGEVYAKENPNTAKLPVGVDKQMSWQFQSTPKGNGVTFDVSYLIPAANPKKLRAARYCKTGPFTSLFTFNEVDDTTGSFSVMRAQGALVVDPPMTYDTGKHMHGFGVIDADGDNCTDVVYAKEGHLGFAKGLSTTFDTNNYFFPTVLKNLASVEIFDVNNDGTLDMVLVDSLTDTVRFFLNDGAGNFVAAPQALPVLGGAGDLQLGDIDGDGCNDLAVQGKFGVAIIMSLACQ